MSKAALILVGALTLTVALGVTVGCVDATSRAVPSPLAREVAAHALDTYADDAVAMLADLVAFRTFHPTDLAYTENPQFSAMRDYLERVAGEFGFDFENLGPLVVIGLGNSPDRVGVVAHGDVQPVDPEKWAADPFLLDRASEPGRLVARGTEDDKGPLVNALFAMKAIKDKGVPLDRRIELIVAWTEEWSWTPIRALLETWNPPQINIAFDANYPVVVAEKGWGQIEVTFPEGTPDAITEPSLVRFLGGSFLSQVPEDAAAEIANPTHDVEAGFVMNALSSEMVDFDLQTNDGILAATFQGLSAHSSVPWNGRNALTHLARIVGRADWPETAAATTVRFINDLVGTGDYAEKFGDLAYSDPFMGRLTLTLATVRVEPDGDHVVGISFRRPAGRSREQVQASIDEALDDWVSATGFSTVTWETQIYNPYEAGDAPQIPVLLDVFGDFAGVENPQPIAIGGGTNASLLPNGVSFGPSMPGRPYTGHSEHEFVTEEQFRLDLQMYTAALVELAQR